MKMKSLSARTKVLIVFLCAVTVVGAAVAIPILERALTVTIQSGPRLFELWNADRSAQISSVDYDGIYSDQINAVNLTTIYIHNTDTSGQSDLNITVHPSATFNSTYFNLLINATNLAQGDEKTLWNNGPGTWILAMGHDQPYPMEWVQVKIWLWLKPDANPPAGAYDFQLLWDAPLGSWGP